MIEQMCLDTILLESAKEVFETMIFMDIEKCAEDKQDIDGWALLGSITFTGTLEGCLAICCGTSCAEAISMNMLGLDTTENVGEEEICDAMGEIANMVMGSVKSRLLDSVGNLEVSIPSVVSGRKLQNNLGEGAKKICVNVDIEDEHTAEFALLYREHSD